MDGHLQSGRSPPMWTANFDPVSEDTLVRKVRSRGKSKNLYATYEPHIDNAGIP